MSDHFVIDPSVLIQGYIHEPHSGNVLALLDGLKDPISVVLHAPEFCLMECANILWRHVRFHGMPAQTANKAVADLVSLPLTIHLAAAHLTNAMTLGLTYDLAVYDSVYIALAQAFDLPLITIDAKQQQAALASGAKIKLISDFKATP